MGAVALAVAPYVAEVVGVDVAEARLDLARRDAPANVTFALADATRLPFPHASFDIACCVRTLHHVARPELVVAELTRVARGGGRVLVVDQLAPADPLAALDLDRFERARDPSHARLLPDVDLRHLFEANELVLEAARVEREQRELEPYLDLAGCEGDARERARAVAPAPSFSVDLGWYLLRKPPPCGVRPGV